MTNKKTTLASKKFTLRKATMALTLMALFAGCAKDREDKVGSDQEVQDITTIASIDGQEFTVSTLQPLGRKDFQTDALDVNLSSKDLNDNFTLVTYNTSSDLFQDVPFFGLPGTEYKLRYEVTNTHLVLNKIAKAELIPFHERTYAKSIGNGMLAVPMIGYPVTLYRQQHQLNADNERTNIIQHIAVKTLAEATHMKYDRNSPELFKAVKKTNVIPVEYFVGKDEDGDGNPDEEKEWFYSSTIVGAPPELANFIGFDVTQDFSFSSVSRIKFVKNKNALIGVNLNIDDKIDTSDSNNLQIAVQIPVDWVDYRRLKKGDQEQLEEETLDEENKESNVYTQKRFLKAKFNQVATGGALTFDTGRDQNFVLEQLEITDDYISFVIKDEINIKTRYSFRAAHKPKTHRTKQYFRDDFDIFGYFMTYKNVINDYDQTYPEDRDKNVLINYHMPEVDEKDGQRKIIYRFSKRTTTEEMKEVGRIAVRVWDEAFQKAGTGIRVVLDESKAVNLGDLRYNIINVVDNKNGGNLLGYGPSIADSKSGEIISSSSNIYADPFRRMLFRDIRNYIRAERGYFDDKFISAVRVSQTIDTQDASLQRIVEHANKVMGAQIEDASNEESPFFSYKPLKDLSLLAKATKAYSAERVRLKELKPKMLISEFIKEVRKSEAKLAKQFEQTNHGFSLLNSMKFTLNSENGLTPSHSSFLSANKDVVDEIRDRCGKEITEYISELSDDEPKNDREKEVIENCINKKFASEDSGHEDKEHIHVERRSISLLQSRVLSTLVHEMGHNFSLRHNFYGSTDHEHFHDEGEKTSQTSSIMDYNRGNVYELLAPGKYDIEALRFAYGDAVKTESGEIVPVDKTKPLLAQLKEKNKKRMNLKFCTDFDASLQIDPLCARHDHGTNPMEVVDANIESLEASRQLYGYRYGKADGPNSGFQAFIALRNLSALRQIYTMWRSHLAEFLSEDDKYLSKFTPEQYQAKLEEMKNHPVHGKNYAEYFEASRKAYEYLKSIAFTPARYCLVQAPNLVEKVQLIDFEELQKNVYRDYNKMTIHSCTDQMAESWVNEFMSQSKILAGVGEFANDVGITLNEKNKYDFFNTEIAGFGTTRMFAFLMLTDRSPDLLHNALKDFRPSFMDNPIYLQDIAISLVSRMINGLTPNTTPHINIGIDYAFRKFANESNDLLVKLMFFRNALFIPGDTEASTRRGSNFIVDISPEQDRIRQGFEVIQYAGNYIGTPPNSLSNQMVNRMVEILNQQALEGQNIVAPAAKEEIKAAINELEINKHLLSKDTLFSEETTVKNIVESSSAIAKIIAGIRSEKEVLATGLINSLVPYVFFNQVTTQQPDFFTEDILNMKAQTFINDEIGQFLSGRDFLQPFIQVGESPLGAFAQETITQILEAMPPVDLDAINAQKALQEDYVNNKKDRDDQLNTLIQAIFMLGR